MRKTRKHRQNVCMRNRFPFFRCVECKELFSYQTARYRSSIWERKNISPMPIDMFTVSMTSRRKFVFEWKTRIRISGWYY